MTKRGAGARRHWLAVLLVLGLAVVGLALGAAAVMLGRWVALQALVPALEFWGGLSVGSLALLLVHRLTGGQWGEDLRPPLLAAAGALPMVALLAVPLLLGLDRLYPWAVEARDAAGSVPAHWYLNPPAFTVRTLAILVLWLILAWSLGAYGRGSKSLPGIGASAFGLLLLVLGMTLIAFDWVMSLDPEWYSAIFGLLVGVSQALAATALAVLWLGLERWRVERRQPSGSGVTPRQSPDAGNLLLAILLLWGYLALMQLVTIWIANLPDEIRWLVPRLQTGWRWLGLAAVVLLPGLGLALLLSPRIKTHPRLLALAAGVVLAAQALYALWLTLPTLRPAGPRLTLLDLAVLLGAGALWLAAFGLYLALAGRAAPVRKGRLPATLPDVRNRHGVPAGSAPAAPPIPIGTAVRSAATAIAETGSHALAASGERVVAPAVAAGARAREQVPGGIAAGTVVKTMAGIAAVLIVSAVVLLPWRHQPGATAHPPAVGPALLANPVANLAVYRRSQQEQVGAWGWVSRKDGIARIPVDRAIQILLARKPPPASTQEARP